MWARRHAGIGGAQHLAPPLQADLTQHRLADGLTHPRDFVIEGVKREKRLVTLGRRKQGGLVAVAIVLPHQRGERQSVLRRTGTPADRARFTRHKTSHSTALRSEERRVGKE